MGTKLNGVDPEMLENLDFLTDEELIQNQSDWEALGEIPNHVYEHAPSNGDPVAASPTPKAGVAQ